MRWLSSPACRPSPGATNATGAPAELHRCHGGDSPLSPIEAGEARDTRVMGSNELAQHIDRPAWAERMRAERAARGWSQADAVDALRVHAKGKAAGRETLIRNWKRWEAGTVKPDDFPPERRAESDSKLAAATGMDTLEIVSRLRASDVSTATLDALRITADRLCCEYPYMSSEQLRVEGQAWLRRITALLERRLSLSQHQEVLSLAGTVALLLGCVEYDMGSRRQAESTRRAALSLAEEAGDANQMGWAYEMRAWFALTQGDYRGAIAAAEAGQQVAPNTRAAVQLAAQQAKGWARLGDRRQVEVALDKGRSLLESLPYPDDLDNHFVVDPAKFDFYAMDCYRVVGENDLAKVYAQEVIRSSTDIDGSARKPMRIAEAKVTLGVVAARSGELDTATALGTDALLGDRKSLPSLVLASRELVQVLSERYPNEPESAEYLERLRALSA